MCKPQVDELLKNFADQTMFLNKSKDVKQLKNEDLRLHIWVAELKSYNPNLLKRAVD